MSQRRGISLVELMLTLSACCVILTLSATLLHRAMHAQSKARLFFDGERSALRLSHSFRRDVHDASAAATGDEAGGDEVLVRLEMAGGQAVEYRQSGGRVDRTWQAEGRVLAREAFVFTPETRVVVAQESPRLITLSIVPPVDTGTTNGPLLPYTVPIQLRVEAVLGRNASLAETTQVPETSS